MHDCRGIPRRLARSDDGDTRIQPVAGGGRGTLIDPSLQRKVFYHDLNLAQSRDQRLLRNRIYQTAQSLCFDINLVREETCPSNAVRSTSGQVKTAIQRAELRMAGKPAAADVAITMVITAR